MKRSVVFLSTGRLCIRLFYEFYWSQAENKHKGTERKYGIDGAILHERSCKTTSLKDDR